MLSSETGLVPTMKLVLELIKSQPRARSKLRPAASLQVLSRMSTSQRRLKIRKLISLTLLVRKACNRIRIVLMLVEKR